MTAKASLRTRVFARRDGAIDWDSISTDDLIAFRDKTNRARRSKVARLVTGFPDRGVEITERTIDLAGRSLVARVNRPRSANSALPLVVQFHGGGFAVGTAAQNDWLNSRVAARCNAVVASIEYRLAPEHPLPAAVDDARDAFSRIVRDAAEWGIDPERVAAMGESVGGALAALTAIDARDAGLHCARRCCSIRRSTGRTRCSTTRPCTDNAENPTLSLPLLRAYRRFSLPESAEAGHGPTAHDGGSPRVGAALILTAELDPVADHGRAYAGRLRAAGTETTLTGYARATHGFLSTPRLSGEAKPAGRAVVDFLSSHLRP